MKKVSLSHGSDAVNDWNTLNFLGQQILILLAVEETSETLHCNFITFNLYEHVAPRQIRFTKCDTHLSCRH